MKTLLFANTAWYLYNFRLPLAEALRSRGYTVILISPRDEYADKLIEAGFQWIEFSFSRKGQNPFRELGTIARLTSLYRQLKPDFVHHFTIKCVLYGSMAARFTGIKRVINSITGLGYLFIGNTPGQRLLRPLILLFYRIGLKSTQVIFQNGDDLQQFLEHGLVTSEQVRIIRGSGVDLEKFHPTPEPAGQLQVLLPARMLWDKGVGEFVQAARMLRAEGRDTRFLLVGDTDEDNPAAVPIHTLQEWQAEGIIEWPGWLGDMPAVMSRASIVCLPSYREGLPKTLIEAAACARPLVAFNAPGSREVVIPGETGWLARFKDVEDLADCLRRLLRDKDERARLGFNARKLVEREFSTGRIVRETLSVYSKLQGDETTQ